MATNVHNLNILEFDTRKGENILNKYLFVTDSMTRKDWRLSLDYVITKVASAGLVGSSLVQSQIGIDATIGNTFYIKNIKLTSDFAKLDNYDSYMDIDIQSTNIDLNKCSNTNSLFLKTVNLTTNVGTTILPVANGGTSKSSWLVGDVVYASGTSALSGLAAVATGNVLLSGGASTAPAWGKVSLTSHVANTLPVGNGGTGKTSFTSNGVVFGNNTGVLGVSAAGTNGQLLMGGTGAPAFATLASSDSTISFAAGSNSLSLSTKITTLQNPAGTAGLIVDGSGNLVSQNNATLTYKRSVINSTTSTLAPTAAQSGALFTLNRAAGMTITLPNAAAGLTYEFHVGTSFEGTFQINAGSSADTLQGIITMSPSLLGTATNGGSTTMLAGPAAADHQYIANANTKGRLLGTRLKYTAITDSIWLVEGSVVTIGSCATPFS